MTQEQLLRDVLRHFRVLFPIFIRMAGQELVQVDRFELLAGQGLLQRRQLQDRLEDCGHGTVVGESLVVKDQVLEGAFLDGLQYEAMGAVDRRDDLDRSPLHEDGFCRAVFGADAAAQADFGVDDGTLAVRGGVGCDLNGKCLCFGPDLSGGCPALNGRCPDLRGRCFLLTHRYC